MIGYIIDNRTHEVLYVTDLPGHGGKDWEYGNKKYAIDLSEYWQRRFRKDMERIGKVACFIEKRYVKNPQHRMRYVNRNDNDEEVENADEEESDEETIVVRRGDRFVVAENFSEYCYDIPGTQARHRISGTIEFLEGDQLVFNGIMRGELYEFLYYPKLSKKRAAEFKFVVKDIDGIMKHLYPLS